MPKELAWEETLLSRTNKAKEEGKYSVEEGEMCQLLEVPLRPIRPHLHDIPSDGGPDIGGTGDSATVEDTITTAPPSSQPQQGSQVTNRLLAVGQRFRNAPPSLLRRMGVVGGGSGQHDVTQAPPQVLQHNDVANESSKRKSNSNFISL